MSKIEFNEENEFHIKSRALFGAPQTPTMIRILLKTGIVKTEKQAMFALLGLVCALIVVTIYVVNITLITPKVYYVVAPDGTKYDVEEYVRLLGKGENPLNPEK